MVKQIVSLFFILTSLSANTLEDELLKCYKLSNDSQRLLCYDMIASSLEQKESKLQSIGKWDIKLKVDPITQKKFFLLSLPADIGHGKWNKPVTLHIKYEKDRKVLYINWKNFVQNSPITLKIDGKLYNKKRWKVSKNGKITYYSGKSEVLINKLLKANKLSVKSNIIDSSPTLAIFDISGLKEVYESIQNIWEME